MIKGIPTLSKSTKNIEEFFKSLLTGDIFSFNIKDFLYEEVAKLSGEYKKVILLAPTGSYLAKKFGDSACMIMFNIDDEKDKIIDAESMRTRKELANCYKRIEDLETQIGLRGADRLQKCEYCYNPLYSYQTWVTTDSGGTAHSECLLTREMEKALRVIKKKEELVKKWTNESQQLSNETHELRVTSRTLSDELSAMKEVLKTTQNLLDDKRSSFDDTKKSLDTLTEKYEELLKEYEGKSKDNTVFHETLIAVIKIFAKTMRLLGSQEGDDFLPLQQVKMPGELRVEIKGWCKPIYDDIKILAFAIEELIRE